MGSRGKRKEKIKETYIVSKENSNTSNICNGCPCRIYNTNGIIRYGKGNLFADYLIVLPPYKTEDLTTIPVEEEILNDILDLVNIDINNCYITRAIKCYSPIKGINYNSAYKCYSRLTDEINYIKPKTIILFGREIRVYYNSIRELGFKGKLIVLPTFMVKFYDEVAYLDIVKRLKKELE